MSRQSEPVQDRHCPKCQSLVRAQWLQDREAELLPVEYFHVVFTVPRTLAASPPEQDGRLRHPLPRHRRDPADDRRRPQAPGRRDRLLGRAAHLGPEPAAPPARALRGARRRAVPTGSAGSPAGPAFFCRCGCSAALFRGKFLRSFAAGVPTRGTALPGSAGSARRRRRPSPHYLAPGHEASGWSTPSRPSADPSRCSSTWPATRIAWRSPTTGCSSSPTARSPSAGRTTATIAAQGDAPGRRRSSSVASCCTSCPSGLQRIRHYGLLANCHREAKLEQCRQLLAAPPPPPPDEPADYLDQYQRLTGKSLRDCPQCGKGQMVRIESFLPGTLPRGPPASRHECSPTTPAHVLRKLCREPAAGHCRLFTRRCSSTSAHAI